MVTQADPDVGIVTEDTTKPLAPPPMYQVVLLNDDFTPMDFVVMILQEIFGKTLEEASHIMLKVHHEGRGICGIYTKDIAATRVDRVRQIAQAHGHPLQCIMEPV
ncbi:MAG TPA: ATP-dependent Clp protease adapter ClpS [Burkholderiaceae bacterium]|nr:ATP-dependent Clp protease adapter ClpS [Burkholderiaceae bacterium]